MGISEISVILIEGVISIIYLLIQASLMFVVAIVSKFHVRYPKAFGPHVSAMCRKYQKFKSDSKEQ